MKIQSTNKALVITGKKCSRVSRVPLVKEKAKLKRIGTDNKAPNIIGRVSGTDNKQSKWLQKPNCQGYRHAHEQVQMTESVQNTDYP